MAVAPQKMRGLMRRFATAAASTPNVESMASVGLLHKLVKPTPQPHSHQQYAKPLAAGANKWTPNSKRVGVLAFKAGMTADWDKWGVRKTLTVLQLDDVIVTGHSTEETRGYTALQVGCFVPKALRLSNTERGHFMSLGIAPRTHLQEFRVTPDAFLPIGTPLTCHHFIPGQRLKVSGITQGKGFQGAMKRHGFKGQGASHGNSVSHRVLGATGCRQDPGKVIKGKKMPGQMGGDRVTVDGLLLYKVDIKRNLLYVEGSVPGKAGGLLRVSDSLKHPFTVASPPPFPTYQLTGEDKLLLAKWQAGAYLSPSEEAYLAQIGQLPAGYEREPAFEFLAPAPETDPFAIPADDEPSLE